MKKKSKSALSFEQFCKHFGIPKPKGYHEIVDAYVQYEHDYAHGGYVSPDDYYTMQKTTQK